MKTIIPAVEASIEVHNLLAQAKELEATIKAKEQAIRPLYTQKYALEDQAAQLRLAQWQAAGLPFAIGGSVRYVGHDEDFQNEIGKIIGVEWQRWDTLEIRFKVAFGNFHSSARVDELESLEGMNNKLLEKRLQLTRLLEEIKELEESAGEFGE